MKRVTANYDSGKLRHILRAGEHTVYSDVEVEAGGEDSAPSPHELLAMALASCTSITTRMYAQRKQWPLENTETSVEIERVSVTNTEVFKRTVKFIGNLDDEQRDRLLDIANKCPVHKALSGKIEIHTELV